MQRFLRVISLFVVVFFILNPIMTGSAAAIIIPTPLKPNQASVDTTPTFKWTKLTNATQYKFIVYKDALKVYGKTVPASYCGTTKCSYSPTNVLSIGDYQWQIRAYIKGSWRDPSELLSFNVVSPIPTPLAPNSYINYAKPTFSWTRVPGATQYKYKLYLGETLVYTQKTDVSVCVDNTCSHTPDVPLSEGNYQWRVRAYIGTVWNPFSVYVPFDLKPNPLVGSGRLDGNGIPSDFLGDVHIRKAFAYAFGWNQLISEVYGNRAVQSLQLPMPGMVGFDANAPHYYMDLAAAETEFKLADLDHDGIPAGDETDGTDVWNVGFYAGLAYNEGNFSRQRVAEILAANLQTINPKFILIPTMYAWPDYLSLQRGGQLPVLTAGWLEDLHDPHNWFQPYTVGTYSYRNRMPDALRQQFRTLLDAGVSETDPDLRTPIYHQMTQLYYDQAVGIPMVLTTGRSFEQKWITSRIKNPLFSSIYYYSVTKSSEAPAPTSSVYATVGDLTTLDPALAYDTASGGFIQNIYETLVFYQGEMTDQFAPQLATEVPTIENDGITGNGRVYTFHIREGVKFHNGNSLTPSDVAYTFQRGLLQGGYASPQWLLAEPFLGVGVDDITGIVDGFASADDRESLKTNDPAVLEAACQTVKNAIVADDAAGTVTMTLAQPWGPFMATIANTYASIMDKEWVIANGGWDGSCTTWQNYYAMTPAEDPFTGIANGTGPYKLTSWTPNVSVILSANQDYWSTSPTYPGGPSGIASIQSVTFQIVPEFADRKAMLENGNADFATIASNMDMGDLVGEVCEWEEETGAYLPCELVDGTKPLRLYSGKPSNVSQDVLIFNFDIQ